MKVQGKGNMENVIFHAGGLHHVLLQGIGGIHKDLLDLLLHKVQKHNRETP